MEICELDNMTPLEVVEMVTSLEDTIDELNDVNAELTETVDEVCSENLSYSDEVKLLTDELKATQTELDNANETIKNLTEPAREMLGHEIGLVPLGALAYIVQLQEKIKVRETQLAEMTEQSEKDKKRFEAWKNEYEQFSRIATDILCSVGSGNSFGYVFTQTCDGCVPKE